MKLIKTKPATIYALALIAINVVVGQIVRRM